MIATSRLAVLALDLQNDIAHPDGKLSASGSAAQAAERGVLARAARVLEGCRAAGLPIGHVRVAFRPDYHDLHSRSPRFDGVRRAGALQIGTWGTEFCDPVAPAEGEVVFTKQSVNPFLTTGLANWLNRRNVEEIVLFGVATNQVVEATARHGDDIGLSVTVLEDCCAAGSAEMHAFAAERMLPIFARVTGSQAFLDGLSGSA